MSNIEIIAAAIIIWYLSALSWYFVDSAWRTHGPAPEYPFCTWCPIVNTFGLFFFVLVLFGVLPKIAVRAGEAVNKLLEEEEGGNAK